MKQMNLLSVVQDIYESSLDDPISNTTLYRKVKNNVQLEEKSLDVVHRIGKAKQPRNILHRKVRWAQQTLKLKGFLERVERGHWAVSGSRKTVLHAMEKSNSMIAMSSRLGVAIWGDAEKVFDENVHEEIHLCVTSPPYPIRVHRAYGGIHASEYSEFICKIIEPIVKRLVKGGNIVLNISNDIFEEKSPARSLYAQYLMIDLSEKLDMHYMDNLIWVSNKSPGPVLYASKTRQQLHYSYEHLLWFTNDPIHCIADNSRVRHLFETKKKHQAFVQNGGQLSACIKSGDGAHKKHINGYKEINGKIPGN